jgi:hypothetical protein
MRAISLTRCVVVALFAGALACARNQETGAAVEGDTTAMTDTTGQVQNPPGYRGMERDTVMVPPEQRQPVDSFLQQQGTDPRADTAGYRGAERPDTTAERQGDTTWPGRADSSRSQWPSDTSGARRDSTMPWPDTATGR